MKKHNPEIPLDIATALRLMGVKGKVTVKRDTIPGIYHVYVNGDKYGIWDKRKATFVD